MNSPDSFDPSYLIGKLTFKYRPNNLKSLSLAVDVMRNISQQTSKKSEKYYEDKWNSILLYNGKQEHTKRLLYCTKKLVENLHRPWAIFNLLDIFRSIHKKEDDITPILVQENQIPYDFLYVLQGIDGVNFVYHIRSQRYVLTTELSRPVCSAAIKVANIGLMIRFIRNYIEKSNSLVQLGVVEVLSSLLNKHLMLVSSIEASFSTLTLPQLNRLLNSNMILGLKAATIICSTIGPANGGRLINSLFKIEKHGFSNISSLAGSAHDKCMDVMNYMIRSWTSKGIFDDPFDEFFIKVRSTGETPSKWWNLMYHIEKEEVPLCFDDSFVSKIYDSGKYLNFFRKWEDPIDLNLDYNLDLNEFVERAHIEANEKILDIFINKYKLLDVYIDIIDFVLLRRGDFAYALIEKRTNDSTKINFLASEFTDKRMEGLMFVMDEEGGALSYRINSVLSIIFSDNDMLVIRTASKILYRLKTLELKYNELTIKKRRKLVSIGLRQVNKGIFTFKFEMLQFIRIILNHFYIQVINKAYYFIKEEIMKPRTFVDLIKTHKRFIKQLVVDLWLAKNSDIVKSLFLVLENIGQNLSEPGDPDLNRKEFMKLVLNFRNVLLTKQGLPKLLARVLTNFFEL